MKFKLPIGLMILATEDPSSKHKWLSNLQETYIKIFGWMYSAQNRINRTNADSIARHLLQWET